MSFCTLTKFTFWWNRSAGESGWDPEVDRLSDRPRPQPRHPPHYRRMRDLVKGLQDHQNSTPFLKTCRSRSSCWLLWCDRRPMGKIFCPYHRYHWLFVALSPPPLTPDLATLEENVEMDAYQTMDDFTRDVQKIFDNCRLYNADGTTYAKCADRLEGYFRAKLRDYVWGWTDWLRMCIYCINNGVIELKKTPCGLLDAVIKGTVGYGRVFLIKRIHQDLVESELASERSRRA